MHRTLERQLKHIYGAINKVPPGIEKLLEVVASTYDSFDKDRRLIDRSLEISSRELELAKNKSETLLASIGEGVFGIDRERSIIYFNPQAEALSGYKASEVVGKPYYDFLKFVKVKDGSENIEFIRTALKGKIADMGNHTMLIRKDKKDQNVLAFAWVTDFPLVEWSKKEKRWDPVHHMFVLPKSGQEKLLDTDPGKVISTQYDLVCNGYELCSGSLRIHTRKLQEKVMQLIGLDLKEARKQFGHLLEAFEYGAPPHGGAAPGIDRLTMLYAQEPNIREVIAFPKTGDGRDLMMDAPSEISPEQLKELRLEIKKPPKKK